LMRVIVPNGRILAGFMKRHQKHGRILWVQKRAEGKS